MVFLNIIFLILKCNAHARARESACMRTRFIHAIFSKIIPEYNGRVCEKSIIRLFIQI